MKSKQTETAVEVEIAGVVIKNTAIAMFHAEHPEVGRVRQAQVLEIGGLIGTLRAQIEPLVKKFFSENMKPIWEVGIKVAEFVDGLPGKELTEDLYRQFVFLDGRGQTISHYLLVRLCQIGRKFPNGVDETFDVHNLWRQMPILFGEQEQLKLSNGAAPRNKTPEMNPYQWLRDYNVRCLADRQEQAQQLAAFRANPQFGDFTTLKSRRPELHAELRQKLIAGANARSAELKELHDILVELA